VFVELRSKTIPGLDGIRGIAAMMVVLYHFGFTRVPGGHGVLVFFVLSGFLITWILLNEHERTGAISLRGFYARRALRILPAFYAFMVVAVVLLVVTHRRIVWTQVAAAAFYGANYFNAVVPEERRNGVLSHLWSLATEEQFYVVWPLCVAALARSARTLIGALAGVIVTLWVYRGGLAYSGGDPEYIYNAFETRADALLVGCLAAVLVKRALLESFWNAVTSSPVAPLLTMSVFGMLTQLAPGYQVAWSLKAPVETVLAAIMIVQMAVMSARSPWWRWLNAPVMRFLGRMSYSVYLYQQIGASPHILREYPWPVRLLVCLPLTLALAAMSHYAIEKPFLRMKDKAVTQNRRARGVAVEVVRDAAESG
jgi:peptidoglycan/LPS O-acetylase OafA/YrhL